MSSKSHSHKSDKSKGKKSKKSVSSRASKNPFKQEASLDDNKVFIECPGATIYEPGSHDIIAGARFVDENDPSKGYDIVGNPVYAPEHRNRRLIKKSDASCIRRCQACQDLTVRMVRREGPDFYIPNHKYPHKKQLKSVDRTW